VDGGEKHGWKRDSQPTRVDQRKEKRKTPRFMGNRRPADGCKRVCKNSVKKKTPGRKKTIKEREKKGKRKPRPTQKNITVGW